MKSYSDFIVDIGALKNNALNIEKMVGQGVKFCAVVKANAYGVGMETVCRTLYGIADYFACACLKEALSIRVFDKVTKILILGCVDVSNLNIIADNNISISVGSLEQLSRIVERVNKKIYVHLQVNTGMNRFGFRSLNEFKKALKEIAKNDNLVLEGLYTHFSTKQDDVAFMNKQYFRFLQFKKLISDKSVICHIANSYATLHSNKFHFDMVRNGFLLYGYAEKEINKPVVSIRSSIVSVFKVKRGDSIGYDRTFKANKSMDIAIIPLGYADGYNRRLSNNFHVLIKGEKCPIVGRICMDVFMVDVTGLNVQIGESVVIVGRQKNEEITIEDMANRVGTSPYEILCDFNYKRMNYIIKDNKNTRT